MKVAMIGTIWWLLIAGLVFTTASTDLQQRLQDLDAFIQNLMTCESRPVVGLTVSVVKDGQTIFAKGYGQRDLQTGQTVDNRTLFGVGSISKSFTSALLASILGEREDVSWDTVLTDILGPSFRFRDQFRTKEATLRDLLAHKTGLENLVFAVRMGQNIDRAELGRRMQYYRQVFPLRTLFYYNNPVYTLAGYVAEKVAGKPYETLLRERVLRPLGMDDTVYMAEALKDGNLSNFAQSYLTYNLTGPSKAFSREEFRVLDLHLPAGGVVSNALDMARYMKFHLSGGRDTAGRAVVPEDTLRQTHTADFLMSDGIVVMDKLEPDWPVEVAMTQGYGMGWWIGAYRGYKRVQHSGFWAGFVSLLALFPDASGGVFTSGNGPYTPWAIEDIHDIIHILVGDILTGKDHWLNATTACTYPEPWWTRPEPNSTVLPEISDNFPRDKRDYEGVYGNHATGNLTISLNATDDKLYFSLGLIGRGLVLPTDSANRIFLRYQGPLAYIPQGPLAVVPIMVVDVGQKDGKVFSLSLQNEPPGPAALFERGLKLTDLDPTEPQWDDCVSGSPERATLSNTFTILLFLAYVYCLI
ncbi:uncharacterized protein [Branchiostoma lanceolatum]|uniref:uncharacterized protein isoform X2 n=1 Tax=Branchiostoma lanceolatum TaxID=7740 RepID=UPI003454E91D